MALENPKVRFTLEDYLLVPEGRRLELIGGDFHDLTPAPNPRHQAILLELAAALREHVRRGGLGQVYLAPVDVVLSDLDVVQPDLCFIRAERLGIVQEMRIVGCPDLVVEILSRSTAARDRTLKRRLYDRYGAVEYWMVDPDARSLEVLARGSSGLETVQVFPEGSEMTSPLLPGLRISVSDLF